MSDSPCRHVSSANPFGRVSWPVDRPFPDQPHASTYVCSAPECIRACSEWVREVTGQPGVFVPFEQEPTR